MWLITAQHTDTAELSRPLESIGPVFLASFLTFLIGLLIITGAQDHMMA